MKQVPIDRLLLETDLPTESVTAETENVDSIAESRATELAVTLNKVVSELSELRNCDMGSKIQQTQDQLYGLASH